MTATANAVRKVYIKTYGCQMNVYDSERMFEALDEAGYQPCDAPESADLILLNTCHIREKAAEKVYSEVGRLRETVAARALRGLETVVGVAGCVAQAEGEEIPRRQPLVRLVVGPQAYHRLPHLLADLEKNPRARRVLTEFPVEDKFDHLPRRLPPRSPTAFLTVQEGCDRFCSFCVVPYTRGAEFSRPVEAVLAEARNLVERGVAEITLLGQNVNAYHGEAADGKIWSLARLIQNLSMIEGLERIRYTTSHPLDMASDLIEAHGTVDKLMPYLHLPVQSGSDRILKAMNRRHTAERYLDVIASVRKARPDIAVSGDFIVGFPGESEDDFTDTLDLVDSVGYAQAFSFRYSPRPGTPAADAPDPVAVDVQSDRLARLQRRLDDQSRSFREGCIGRTLPVLLEKPGRHSGQMVGRSPYLQPVHLEAREEQRGQIVPTRIVAVESNSLSGQIEAV